MATARAAGTGTGRVRSGIALQAFRVAHPEVVIGDGGFGTFQARILEPDGETVITRYRLAELLDKLDELTGERRPRPDDDPR